MLVMRPAQMADLGEVQRLAADSPIGVTSLPDDVERLSDKIAASEASFAAEVSFNGEESYFFVLEDTATGKLVGCSAIVASAGYSEPFYSFRNETFVHASRELKIHNKIHVLSQCHDLTGNSLLTSFYVQRELVGSPWAELNSRGRLLFVASHPERFADSVVTEIVDIGSARIWTVRTDTRVYEWAMEGLDMPVLPMPYHMPATPTPCRNTPPRALRAAASARSSVIDASRRFFF